MTSIYGRLQNMVLKKTQTPPSPLLLPDPMSNPNPNRVFSVFFPDTAKYMGVTHSRKENLY